MPACITGWDPPPSGLRATLWNGDLATEPGTYGLAAEGFKITATGNRNFHVAFPARASLTLSNWSTLATCRLTNGNAIVVDPVPANARARYSRLVWPQPNGPDTFGERARVLAPRSSVAYPEPRQIATGIGKATAAGGRNVPRRRS